MVTIEQKDQYTIDDLRQIMALLRAPDGCPWDRVQTHASIRRNMIEEAYEAVDAIDRGNRTDMIEELGDVLMQVVFHAQIAAEDGAFAFDDVVDGVCRKLIFRHPHVFGTQSAADDREAIADWEAQKKIEKTQKTQTDSMRSVPRMMPALIRSAKIQEKSARSGLDWPNTDAALADAAAQIDALRTAQPSDSARRAHLGRLLFAAVGAVRLSGAEPEELLTRTTDAYIDAFAQAEPQLETAAPRTPDALLADSAR